MVAAVRTATAATVVTVVMQLPLAIILPPLVEMAATVAVARAALAAMVVTAAVRRLTAFSRMRSAAMVEMEAAEASGALEEPVVSQRVPRERQPMAHPA